MMCKSLNMLLAVAIIVMQFHGLFGLGTLSIISGKTFECSSSVTLRFVPASGCCGGTIEWKKDGSLIMTGGSSTIPGKYVQTLGSTYFDLTINDINSNDLDSPYHCVYSLSNSNEVTLHSDSYYCAPCDGCGGKMFGVAVAGVLFIICAVLLLSKCYGELRTYWVTFNIGTAVAGVIIVFFVTFFVGRQTCWCEKINGDWISSIAIGCGIVLMMVIVSLLVIKICGFKISSKRVKAQLGKDVDIKCNVSTDVHLKDFRCLKISSKGQPIQIKSNEKYSVNINEPEFSLTIRNTTEDDAATYKFEADYSFLTTSDTAELIIEDSRSKKKTAETAN